MKKSKLLFMLALTILSSKIYAGILNFSVKSTQKQPYGQLYNVIYMHWCKPKNSKDKQAVRKAQKEAILKAQNLYLQLCSISDKKAWQQERLTRIINMIKRGLSDNYIISTLEEYS